jgi:hypothetical protein
MMRWTTHIALVFVFSNEIVYLEKGGYIVADSVAWASWHDTSATDFCVYFYEIQYHIVRGVVAW